MTATANRLIDEIYSRSYKHFLCVFSCSRSTQYSSIRSSSTSTAQRRPSLRFAVSECWIATTCHHNMVRTFSCIRYDVFFADVYLKWQILSYFMCDKKKHTVFVLFKSDLSHSLIINLRLEEISITIFYLSSYRYRDGERLDRTTETVRTIIAYLNMIDRIFWIFHLTHPHIAALYPAIHEFMCTYSQGIYLNGFSFFFPCVSLALTCAYYNNDKFFTMFFSSFSHASIFLFLLMLCCVSFCCVCVYLHMHITRIYQFRILPARPSCLIIAHIIKWICFSSSQPHTHTTYLYRFAHIYPSKSPIGVSFYATHTHTIYHHLYHRLWYSSGLPCEIF